MDEVRDMIAFGNYKDFRKSKWISVAGWFIIALGAGVCAYAVRKEHESIKFYEIVKGREDFEKLAEIVENNTIK